MMVRWPFLRLERWEVSRLPVSWSISSSTSSLPPSGEPVPNSLTASEKIKKKCRKYFRLDVFKAPQQLIFFLTWAEFLTWLKRIYCFNSFQKHIWQFELHILASLILTVLFHPEPSVSLLDPKSRSTADHKLGSATLETESANFFKKESTAVGKKIEREQKT